MTTYDVLVIETQIHHIRYTVEARNPLDATSQARLAHAQARQKPGCFVNQDEIVSRTWDVEGWKETHHDR